MVYRRCQRQRQRTVCVCVSVSVSTNGVKCFQRRGCFVVCSVSDQQISGAQPIKPKLAEGLVPAAQRRGRWKAVRPVYCVVCSGLRMLLTTSRILEYSWEEGEGGCGKGRKDKVDGKVRCVLGNLLHALTA